MNPETPITSPRKIFAWLKVFIGQPLTWGILAGIFFFFLRAPWVYPGESTQFIAQAMGALPPEPIAAHPLVTLLCQPIIALLPPSMVVGALNLLAVVLGGLCVWLVCATVKTFLTFSITEPNSQPYLQRVVGFAVPMAACSLLLSPYFVLASTHFQWQQVDLFFLLCVLFLVARTLRNGSLRKCTLVALVTGFVVASASTSLLAAPFLFVGLIFAYYLQSRRPTLRRIVTRILLPMGVGAAMTLLAATALSLHNMRLLTPEAEISFAACMKPFIAAQVLPLAQLLNYKLWIVCLLFGVLPGILAFTTASAIGRNLRTFPILGTYVTVVTLATVCFLPFDCTPFRLSHAWQEVYPLMISVLTAFAIAMTCGTSILLTKVTRKAEAADELHSVRFWSRQVARGVLLFVPLLVIGFGGYRLMGLLTEEAKVQDLPRTTVDNILADRQDKETWLLSDGVLDPYLAIRIAETDAPVTLLSFRQATSHTAYAKAQLLQLLETSPHLKACFEQQPELKQTLQYAINDLGGAQPFLQDWLRHDPKATEVLITLLRPELWFAGGYYPVASGLHYSGVPTYAEYLEALTPTGAVDVPTLDETSTYAGKSFAKHLRRHLALLSYYSAQALMTTERKAEAYAIFQAAHRLDPENTPVIIGAYLLLRMGVLLPDPPTPGEDEAQYALQKAEIDAKIARLKEEEAYFSKQIKASRWLSQRQKDSLTMPNVTLLTPNALEQFLVAWLNQQQDPSAFFEDETLIRVAHHNIWGQQALLYERLPGKRLASIDAYQKHLSTDLTPNDRLTCLLKLARLHLQENNLPEAKSHLEQAEALAQQLDRELYAQYLEQSQGTNAQPPAPKVSALLGYDYALYFMATGDLDRALSTLQTFLTQFPGDVNALALLATAQLQKGELKQVRDITMKQLEQAAKTTDTYQIKILQAQLAEHEQNFKAARTAYLRAYELNPQVYALRDIILRMDMRLVDVASAREHARSYLRRDRAHPLSNYILGSIALQEDDLDRALFYLQAATAPTTGTPVPEAFNDLAETYRRQQRWEEALATAKQAYAIAPGIAIAHETAASALLELKRYAEAHQELDTADTIEQDLHPGEPNDPRIAVTRARVYAAEGKLDQARQTLSLARKQYATLDASAKADFDALAARLNLRF